MSLTQVREYEAQFTPSTQGLLFPPEVLAKVKVVDTKGCRHPKSRRVSGPRVCARWGTFPTLVCATCWKWTVAVGARRWKPFDELARATEPREDDEC